MRRRMLIILLLLMGSLAYSQLQPLLDQYYLDGLSINPSYAGSHDALSIGIHTRNQWVGFDGAPRSQTLSVHSPLRNKKVNLGIILFSGKLGSKIETGAILNYAYRIELGNGNFSLGLGAGITRFSTDMEKVVFSDAGDALLYGPLQRATMPEFSLGSYYHNEKFFAGISMPLFLSHYTNNDKYKLSFNLAEATYIVTTGYLFDLSEGIELLPSVLLRTNPANNTQLDLHFSIIFQEKVWIGMSIRTNGNLSAILQMQINPQFRIAYSYGHEISELSTIQSGTHEVVLKYNFKYIIDVLSPRYF